MFTWIILLDVLAGEVFRMPVSYTHLKLLNCNLVTLLKLPTLSMQYARSRNPLISLVALIRLWMAMDATAVVTANIRWMRDEETGELSRFPVLI